MKFIRVGLALINVISFLCIHVSYNGGPSGSIFSALLELDRENVFTCSYDNFTLQFLGIGFLVIITSIIGNRIIMIISLLLLFSLLQYWMYILGGIIDFHTPTMIPFIVALVFSIIYLVRSGLKERMEKGENNQ